MICVFFNFKPVSNLYDFLFYIYNKNLICFNGKKKMVVPQRPFQIITHELLKPK